MHTRQWQGVLQRGATAGACAGAEAGKQVRVELLGAEDRRKDFDDLRAAMSARTAINSASQLG